MRISRCVYAEEEIFNWLVPDGASLRENSIRVGRRRNLTAGFSFWAVFLNRCTRALVNTARSVFKLGEFSYLRL